MAENLIRLKQINQADLSGYISSVSQASLMVPDIVYVTGNQTISGNKTFINNVAVSGTGIFNSLDLSSVDTISLSGVDVTITNGVVILTNPLSAPNLIFNTGNQTISGVKTFFDSGIFSNGGVSATPLLNNPLSVVGSGNSYMQLNIQNRASGTFASADLVITANNGTDNTNYINLGINNSGYSDPAFTNGSGLDGYLFIDGGNLDIGTRTTGKVIEFHAGGTTLGSTIARISQSGLNIVSGNLTVGGTGVLLSGSTPFIINFGHARNNTTAGSQYYYFGPPIDIGPVSLANNEKRRVQIMQDCYLRRIVWTSLAIDNAPIPSAAATGYFKNFGNNPLTSDTTAGIQVTSGINIVTTNIMYNNSTGTLNIPIKSGDFVSFYYQTNYTNTSNSLASGLTVGVNAYFYV